MSAKFANARSIEQARYHALAHGWPALYLALSADILAVAVVHAAYAPWWAAFVLPGILVPKSLIWAVMWYRKRDIIPSTDECREAIRTLSIEITVWMALIVAWEVWLSHWGTPETLLLLALCIGGQFVFILFGLYHLRLASVASASFCVIGMLIISAHATAAFIGILVLVVGGVAGLAYLAQVNFQDFTSLVMSRLKLEHKTNEAIALSDANYRLANTDALTEIGNRRRLFHDLEEAVRAARETGKPLALGIVDLDGFKAINDSNGHLVGDRLLRQIAMRLQDLLSAQSEVYRLGGDEFAFVLRDDLSHDALVAAGTALIEGVHQPIMVGDLRLVLGCSVGFAIFPDAADTVTDLYDRADYALFHAKRTGKLRAVVFNAEHERSVREGAEIERVLRAADLDKELLLNFQPIVDSSRNQTLLLECLARWESPVLGRVSPGKFIPVAEQSGFISVLTPVLLGKALAAIKQWPEKVGISFNLSGHDIISPEKILRIIAMVSNSGVAPHRIEFEVTETALMMNLDLAIANSELLKQQGVRISLDDFGTGYSSLSQIQKLPLDKIKVDASFVRNLTDSAASQKIVRSINALSRDLALGCVVEGVETQEQLSILQDIGCNVIQGYFFSKPMLEADVSAFLDQQIATNAAA